MNAADVYFAELVDAALALLKRLDNMTTEEFSLGGERVERERLRDCLLRIEGVPS